MTQSAIFLFQDMSILSILLAVALLSFVLSMLLIIIPNILEIKGVKTIKEKRQSRLIAFCLGVIILCFCIGILLFLLNVMSEDISIDCANCTTALSNLK